MTIYLETPAYHKCTVGTAAKEAMRAGFNNLLAADGKTTPLAIVAKSRKQGYKFSVIEGESRIYRFTRSGIELGFYKVTP